MNPTAVYAKHPDYVQRDVAGECILVPVRRSLKDANSIYVLNETGAALWRRIDGASTVRDICTAFLDEYDVAPERLNQDVDVLLTDLLSIRAIQEVSVAHAPTG
ncbi:MAG: PqqD family protein [Nitrospira sp.]